MTRMFLGIFIGILLSGCFASAEIVPQTPDKPATSVQPAVKSVPAASARPKATPNKSAAKKTKNTRLIETDISGLAGSDSDQYAARLRFEGSSPKLRWSSRSSFAKSVSRYISSGKVNDTSTETIRVNTRVDLLKGKSYRYLAHSMSTREQERNGKTTAPRSGYQLYSLGVGKQLGRRFRGDVGLGHLSVYGKTDEHNPVLVTTLRGRVPLNPVFSLDSDIIGMYPLSDSHKARMDSDLYLSYQISPDVALRLGWTGTNLLRSIRSNKEWDSAFRLSIAFRNSRSY